MKLTLAFAIAAAALKTPAQAITIENQLAPRDVSTTCTPLSSPQTGAICGQRFRVDDGGTNVLGTQFLDLDTCVDYCGGMNAGDSVQCAGITYNSKTRLCTLYSHLDYFKRDNRGSVVAYDITDCFECSIKCHAPGFLNLLQNANFNDSSTLIGPWKMNVGDYKIIPNPVGPGNALQFTYTRSQGFYIYMNQYLGFCRGVNTKMSFDMKIQQVTHVPPGTYRTNNALDMSIIAPGCAMFWQYEYNDVLFNKWQNYQCSGGAVTNSTSNPVLSTGDIDFQLSPSPEDGTSIEWIFTIANFRFERIPAIPVKTKAASLIANGGFENGKLAPFTVSYQPPDPCTPGKPALDIVSPGLPAQNGITQRSKYRLEFCGIGKITNSPLYGDSSYQNFVLNSALSQKTLRGKRYVITLQYTSNTTFGGASLNYINGNSFDISTSVSGPILFQGVFTSPGGRIPLSLYTTASADGDVDRARIQYSIDNISLRLLDE